MVSLKAIYQELKSERVRLLLTILAIAWGAASISSMLAIGEGLRSTFVRAMSGTGVGLLVVRPGISTLNYQGQSKGVPIQLMPENLVAAKQEIPAIARITGEYEFSATIYHKGKAFYPPLYAVAPEYAGMRNLTAAKGRFINPLDMQAQRRVVFLGDTLAKKIFKQVNPVGQSVLISNMPFRVVGLMQHKLQVTSYTSRDANNAWIPSSTYHGLTNVKAYSDVLILAHHANQIAKIKQDLRHVVALYYHVDPKDPGLLSFDNLNQTQQKTSDLFFHLQIFLGMIGFITLVVAGVGIANVMLMTVKQATRSIGIRMAIGAKTRDILAHYLLECLLVTLLGGALGIVLTEFMIFLIKLIPMHGQFVDFWGKPVPILSTLVMILVWLALALIGIAAGFFPSRKAAMIDPAVALRDN